MATNILSENTVLDAGKKAIDAISGLTDAQKTELYNAQKQALLGDTAKRLEIFQGNISENTKHVLNQKWVKLSGLIPENSFIGNAVEKGKEVVGSLTDTAKNAINTVEWALKDAPFIGAPIKSVLESYDATKENGMTWAEFFKNPLDSLGKLWDVLKECFSAMSFEPLVAFFNPGEIIKKIYTGIDVVGDKLELSYAVKESYVEMLVDAKDFSSLKLSELLELKGEAPSEIISTLKLSTSISENDLKNFMESFFEEKNFAKIEEMARAAGKTPDDLKSMKLSEIFSLFQK